jgi:hypothetical protein
MYFDIHNDYPLGLILSQIHPIHTLTPRFLKVHFIIIFVVTPLQLDLPSGMFLSEFPTQILCVIFASSQTPIVVAKYLKCSTFSKDLLLLYYNFTVYCGDRL